MARPGLRFLPLLPALVLTAFAPWVIADTRSSVVPTTDPGGFEIEGDLLANSPTLNTTDWVPHDPGTSTGVLTSGGTPVDPAHTFHLIDAYDNSDDVFSTGMTLAIMPSNWTWTTSLAARDFNNGLLHLTTDQAGHTWLFCALDRKSTSSTAFMSIELLQGTLVKNADHTFSASGTQQGRTVDDVLLTFVFDPTSPSLSAARWIELSPGSFGFSPFSLPPNAFTFAINSAGAVDVPFGSFGNPTLPTNQFVELGVDLVALLDQSPITFQSIFIYMRSSTSTSSAAISDFIAPLPLNVRVAGVEQAPADGYDLRIASSNPSSGRVELELRLPAESRVDLRVFDLAGREVGRIASGVFPAGRTRATWQPSRQRRPAGLYFVRMNTPARTIVRRVEILP